MEDSLGEVAFNQEEYTYSLVLILVLMEDTCGVKNPKNNNLFFTLS